LSVAHVRQSCGACGTHSFTSACGSVTVRHSQPAGQSSLQVLLHTPPVPPTGSTQYPLVQSLCFVHAPPNSPGVMGASISDC